MNMRSGNKDQRAERYLKYYSILDYSLVPDLASRHRMGAFVLHHYRVSLEARSAPRIKPEHRLPLLLPFSGIWLSSHHITAQLVSPRSLMLNVGFTWMTFRTEQQLAVVVN